MPAITAKKKPAKKGQLKAAGKGSENTSAPSFEPRLWILLAFAGAFLGLSAPGLDQWYLAWVALVPLLLASVSATGILAAFLRGTAFGIGYSLTYLNWYLGLQPLDWLLFNWWQGYLIAAAAWIIVSTHQALIIGIFSAILSKIPLTGSFLPGKRQGQWRLPALLVVPLLWTLVCNLICNARGATGVPWTMLEYSQYRQIPLIQIASVVGGVGLGFLIVMVNTAAAALYCTFQKKSKGQPLSADSKSIAVYQVIALALLIVGCLAFGFQRVGAPGEPRSAGVSPASEPPGSVLPPGSAGVPPASLNVTVVQGNVNIEMQKTTHRYTLVELLTHYTNMLRGCANGLVVLTESALPTYLREAPETLADLESLAKSHNFDMVVGSLDHDQDQNPYNSAFGIDSHGHVAPEAYHKRYLVPFGEYTPLAVNFMPEWMRRLTNTPAGGGFASGTGPVALNLTCAKVAPLVCFETISPGLVASSVRNGGQLLVNISDLAWFHKSLVGQQMLAFSVMRAVENSRYFVFAANTGPSAIIDAKGRTVQLSEQNTERLLAGKVMLSSEITPFTHWFVF